MDLDVMEKRYRKLEAEFQEMRPLLEDWRAHKASAGYQPPDPHSPSGAMARSVDIEARCEAALARVDAAVAGLDALRDEMQRQWQTMAAQREAAIRAFGPMPNAQPPQQPGQAAPDPHPAPTAPAQPPQG